MQTLEEGQYKLFNMSPGRSRNGGRRSLPWPAVIGQNASVDTEEEDVKEMEHEEGARTVGEEVSQRLRAAERLVYSVMEHDSVNVEEALCWD